MAPKSVLRVRSSGSVASNRRSGARGGVESAGVWLADAPVATHTPTRPVSAAPHLCLTRSKLTEQVYGRRGGLASGSPRACARGQSDCFVKRLWDLERDRKSTRLNSSHVSNSYAVFCLKKKKLLTSLFLHSL